MERFQNIENVMENITTVKIPQKLVQTKEEIISIITKNKKLIELKNDIDIPEKHFVGAKFDLLKLVSDEKFKDFCLEKKFISLLKYQSNL